jgi:glycosyltransferase involved in cell wall biosynthesis
MGESPKAPRIVVLLATYKGEMHLRSQLDSLLAQSLVPDLILARDDGSDDGTRAILAAYARAHPCVIQVIDGVAGEGSRTLGFVGNFLTLLRRSPIEARYIFFCDQDDVWLPTKIERTVEALDHAMSEGAGPHAPLLAFTRLSIVGPDLTPRALSPVPRRPGFGHALGENAVTGCSMCVNGALARLVKENPPQAARVVAHDWWFYLVASGLGHVIYVPEPTILYRQHGANVEGATTGPLATLLARVRGLRSGKWARKRPWSMFEEFHSLHATHLTTERRRLLEDYALLAHGRMRACARVLAGQVRRDRLLDSVIMFLTVFLRRR